MKNLVTNQTADDVERRILHAKLKILGICERQIKDIEKRQRLRAHDKGALKNDFKLLKDYIEQITHTYDRVVAMLPPERIPDLTKCFITDAAIEAYRRQQKRSAKRHGELSKTTPKAPPAPPRD